MQDIKFVNWIIGEVVWSKNIQASLQIVKFEDGHVWRSRGHKGHRNFGG